MTTRRQHDVDKHRQVSPLVKVTHVKQVRRGDACGQLGWEARIGRRKAVVHTQQRDGHTFSWNAVRGRNLSGGEARYRQNVRGGVRAATIKGPARPVTPVGIPLWMPFIADVVDREYDRHRRPERRRVGGRVNDIDGGASGGARQADKRPAEVGGGMRRFGDVVCTGGQHTRIPPPERNDRERFTERQQGARQRVDVSADTGRRRGKRAAIDADAKHVGQRYPTFDLYPLTLAL